MVSNRKKLIKFLSWKAIVFIIPFVFTFCTNNMENMYLATASYAALPTGTPIDSDNDGKIDGLDITGDSIIDMTFIQPTSIPATGIDITGNGKPDFYLYQTANGSTFNTSKDGTGNTVTPIVVGGVVMGYDTTGDSIPEIGTAGSTLYKVKYTLSGLATSSMIISITVNNGVPEYVTLTSNVATATAFASSLTDGQYYEVKVVSSTQQCSVTGGGSNNGTGVINKADVTNIAISCGQRKVSVTVTAAPAGFSVYVSLNVNNTTTEAMSTPITATATPAFFNSLMQTNSSYTVSLISSSSSCKFSGANSGIMGAVDINVNIVCAPFTVDNSTAPITGLATGSITLGLYQNGVLAASTSVNAGTTAFSFPNTYFYTGDTYQVSILSVTTERCKVSALGSGIISGSVTGVQVACATLTVGGTADAGLTGTATLSLSINGTFSETKNQAGPGAFTFGTKLFSGESYDVQILSLSSTNDSCKISGNIGTISGAYSGVAVECAQYTITGTINPTASGYSANLTAPLIVSLYRNGTLMDTQVYNTGTAANTGISFSASSQLFLNDAYSIQISSTQNCKITNSSGVISASVSNVQIECAEFTISGSIVYSAFSGVAGTVNLQLQVISGTNVYTEATSVSVPAAPSSPGFSFATLLLDADSYSITVTSESVTGSCTLGTNTSGTINGSTTGSITNAAVNCP